MTKDNVTGKNKDFYDLGKKIFDRLNPQGAINPKIVEPKKEWVGLTKEELAEITEFHFHGALSGREFYDDVEAKLKGKNA